MAKRVGRRKRMSRYERMIGITNAVEDFTVSKKGYATASDVAKRLGLTASSHLNSLLEGAWTHEWIDRFVQVDNRLRVVYCYKKQMPPHGGTRYYYVGDEYGSNHVVCIPKAEGLPWIEIWYTRDYDTAKKHADREGLYVHQATMFTPLNGDR